MLAVSLFLLLIMEILLDEYLFRKKKKESVISDKLRDVRKTSDVERKRYIAHRLRRS